MDFTANKTFDKLKYDLVRDGLVSFEDVEKAKEISEAQNINIGQVLVNSGLLNEDTLLKFLEAKLHIPYVNLEDFTLDKNCLNYISLQDAKRYKIIPLFKIEDTLTVAMADPLDLFAIDNILEGNELVIEPVISSEKSVLKKIEEYYDSACSVGDLHLENEKKYDWREELHNNDLSEEHIQALIRAILKQAISSGVHELFFEHIENGLSVNFKNGTRVENTGVIPGLLIAPFVTKIKVLSELDPSVSVVPQLGKLIFRVDDMDLTASICAFPTINSERISLKIYKPPKKLSTLIDNEKISQIKTALEHPGIVLVCGSSLSGKTHLIYSILSELIEKNKTAMTLESIAKYRLAGVSQCELNENIGFSLDKAMRFIEFQSPDIIYFEGITSKEGLDFFTSLVMKDKTLITEFLADNVDGLRKKLSYADFSMFKNTISCLIFIHGKDSIEIFNKKDLEKYL